MKHAVHHAVHAAPHAAPHVAAVPLPPAPPPSLHDVVQAHVHEAVLHYSPLFPYALFLGFLVVFIFVHLPQLRKFRESTGLFATIDSDNASMLAKLKAHMAGQWAQFIPIAGAIIAAVPDILSTFDINSVSPLWTESSPIARIGGGVALVMFFVNALTLGRHAATVSAVAGSSPAAAVPLPAKIDLGAASAPVLRPDAILALQDIEARFRALVDLFADPHAPIVPKEVEIAPLAAPGV